MTWTKERPVRPGWYWFRTLHDGKVNFLNIMMVFAYGDTLLARSTLLARGTVTTSEFINNMGGEWAGPIEEPKEQV